MKQLFLTLAAGLMLSSVGFAKAAPTLDIVDTAVSVGQFKTLVAAVQAAGLESTLRSRGPFTVFAPTDAAFAKLPAGTVEALLKDIPTLTKILTYHVIAGSKSVTELEMLGSLKTVQGEDVEITGCNGRIYVNNSEVVLANVQATNGTIQVIDAVLLPQ
jgi:uncharacterized surface protein with fasciclin (FAS1) repeats